METKKILVPTNFSESAFRALLHAATLAEQTGAEIHLVHIIHYPAFSVMHAPDINLIAPTTYTFFSETKRQQMELIRRWVHEKFSVTIHLAMPEGSTIKQLTNYVSENNIDLIILHDTDKKSFWSRLLGNKAKKIQQATSVPVITILESTEKPFNWSDVVIPVVDNVPESRIRTIARVAEKFKITIHLVALGAWGTAKRPLNILIQSLKVVKMKCNAPVICRELKGDHLQDAARQYAAKIHANALIENNHYQKKRKGILTAIAEYFEKADYPYITSVMI